jgi:hypothetical protein
LFAALGSFLSRVGSFFVKRHKVQMVARQKADDLATLYIDCVRKKHVKGLMDSLRQDGFTEGPMPSNECSLRDGEQLQVSFMGDLQVVGEYAQLVRFHHSHDRCRQQVFIEKCKPAAGDSRGYVLFSSVDAQRELCKLPIRLKVNPTILDLLSHLLSLTICFCLFTIDLICVVHC